MILWVVCCLLLLSRIPMKMQKTRLFRTPLLHCFHLLPHCWLVCLEQHFNPLKFPSLMTCLLFLVNERVQWYFSMGHQRVPFRKQLNSNRKGENIHQWKHESLLFRHRNIPLWMSRKVYYLQSIASTLIIANDSSVMLQQTHMHVRWNRRWNGVERWMRPHWRWIYWNLKNHSRCIYSMRIPDDFRMLHSSGDWIVRNHLEQHPPRLPSVRLVELQSIAPYVRRRFL